METDIILNIVLSICIIISIFVSYYFFIKKKISDAASGAINNAEQSDKTGEEKFKQAVDEIMKLIPPVMKPFIARSGVELIVQHAFDGIEAYAKKQVEKK